MKLKQTFLFLPTVLCIGIALAACASQPKAIPPDLSAAESFQRAQDAADNGNYALAIRYYTTFRQNNPNNPDRDIWALYEIAFNYHKMGKNAMAVSLLDQLLQQYQNDTGNLPPAPRILALKLKDRLASVTVSPTVPAATPSAPAAAPAAGAPAPATPATPSLANPAPTAPAK
jgi:tetratricopeptide (TPR) repeat protein